MFMYVQVHLAGMLWQVHGICREQLSSCLFHLFWKSVINFQNHGTFVQFLPLHSGTNARRWNWLLHKGGDGWVGGMIFIIFLYRPFGFCRGCCSAVLLVTLLGSTLFMGLNLPSIAVLGLTAPPPHLAHFVWLAWFGCASHHNPTRLPSCLPSLSVELVVPVGTVAGIRLSCHCSQ